MAQSLKDALAGQANDLEYIKNSVKRVKHGCKTYNVDKLFKALHNAEPACTIYAGMYTVQIVVPVKSMKHMLEVIEFAEQVTGIEFDDSDDLPASGQRTFYSKDWDKSFIRIMAQVPLTDVPADQLCTRVQTGVEVIERPVYTLQCADAEQI